MGNNKKAGVALTPRRKKVRKVAKSKILKCKPEETLKPADYDKKIHNLKEILKEAQEPLKNNLNQMNLVDALKQKIMNQKENEVKVFTENIKKNFLHRFIFSLVGDLVTEEDIGKIANDVEDRMKNIIIQMPSVKSNIKKFGKSDIEFGWTETKDVAIRHGKIFMTMEMLQKNDMMKSTIAVRTALFLLEKRTNYALDNLVSYYSQGEYNLQTVLNYTEDLDFENLAKNFETIKDNVLKGMSEEFPITRTILSSKGTMGITTATAVNCLHLTEDLGFWHVASAIYNEKWRYAQQILENEFFRHFMFGNWINKWYKNTDGFLDKDIKRAIKFLLGNEFTVKTIEALIELDEKPQSVKNEKKDVFSDNVMGTVDLLIDEMEDRGIELKNASAQKMFIMVLLGICKEIPQVMGNPNLLVKD
ncbi:hypothetical protein ACFLQI_00405 [Candidatus Undinarchaeota archaeon]